jgi:hypothetical protein
MAVDLLVIRLVDHTLGIHAMVPKGSFVGRQHETKNGSLL